MIRYVIHNPSNGEILSDGLCVDDDFHLIEDAIDINGVESVDDYYIIQGRLVKLPEKGTGNRFDYEARKWIFDEVLALAQVRRERDALLAGTDWTQLPDVPEEIRDTFAPYRKALRDITDRPLESVVFPAPPQLPTA
jgi:hypothetical protein